MYYNVKMFKIFKVISKSTKRLSKLFELPSLNIYNRKNVVKSKNVVNNTPPASKPLSSKLNCRFVGVDISKLPDEEYIEAKFNMLNKRILIGLILSTIAICIFCSVMFMYVAPSFCKALFYGVG